MTASPILQVLYCADKQRFSGIREAMRKGEQRDGAVTLVLERDKSSI